MSWSSCSVMTARAPKETVLIWPAAKNRPASALAKEASVQTSARTMTTDGSKANMMFRPLRLAIATASAPCAFSNLMSKESMASMMRSMSTAGSALSTEVSDAEFCELVMVVLAFPGHKVRVLLFDPFKGTQDGINGGHDERIKLVARYASANM